MIRAAGVIAIDGISESMAFSNRNRRQVDAICNIPNGIDGWDIGLAVLINDNRAFIVGGHASVFQSQIISHRVAACGGHNNIDHHLLAIIERHFFLLTCGFNFCDCNARVHMDTAGRCRFGKTISQVLVKTPQRLLCAINQMGFSPKTIKNTSEFNGDIPAAKDNHLVRTVAKIKRFIRRDRMVFQPWDIWHAWPTTNSNQNPFCCVCFAINFNRMFIFDAPATFDQCDASITQQIGINPCQPIQFSIFSGNQLPPIMGRINLFPTETNRIV